MTKINPECPFDKESFDFFIAHKFYNYVRNSDLWQETEYKEWNYFMTNNLPAINFELLHPRIFREFISHPLQNLFEIVVSQLPIEITQLSDGIMHTDFFKKGNNFNYYERALIFITQEKSLLNPQFYIRITEESLNFGFRIRKSKDFKKENFLLEDKTCQLFIYNFRNNFYNLSPTFF